MAVTNIATGATIAKKVYAEKTMREAIVQSYWNQFSSSDGETPVFMKKDLAKGGGESIVFPISLRMVGDGVSGDATLENNEEELNLKDFTVTIDQERNGVVRKGRMADQRASFNLMSEMMNGIKNWWSEKLDKMHFDAVYASTLTKIFYGGSATSEATVTASDLLTPQIISKAATYAATGGGFLTSNNRRQDSLVEPVRVAGRKYRVLMVHPDVLYDLHNDPTFSQAAREALARSPENVMFSGAEFLWNGVVIHAHERVQIETDWGSGSDVAGARNFLFGKQALCFAQGAGPFLEEETWDYGNRKGMAMGSILGIAKVKFDVDDDGTAEDAGIIGVSTARTNISNAT